MIGGLLERRGGGEDAEVLADRSEELEPHRELGVIETARYGDPGEPGEVAGDRQDVARVEGEGIAHLRPDRERSDRAGRTGDEVDIVVNDLRTQVYHPEAFEQLGIDLSAKSLITVKSLFHFFGPFQPIAARIIQVATPGGTSPDFRSMNYTKLTSAYWPAIETPFES